MLRFPLRFTRRRFAFWVGLGLFHLGEKLRADGFDMLAAVAMRATEAAKPSTPAPEKAGTAPEHWTAAENNTWRWFERENLSDGVWKVTGITRPVHKETGEPYALAKGYLDESLVPDEVRNSRDGVQLATATEPAEAFEADHGKPSNLRRARHGRPPSRWLRSLNADEIRTFLKTIEVPEAGVSGMTFWTHLTRDHSFDPEKIEGLTIPEQAKLHAAAHYGY